MILWIVLLATAGSCASLSEPWPSWLTPLQTQGAPPDGGVGAAGRDLEVGVAIGVPTAAPYTPENGFTEFGSPGWNPISPCANRFVRIDAPATYQLALPVQPSESRNQPWSSARRIPMAYKRPQPKPSQSFQAVQRDQPNNVFYQGSEEANLTPVEWEEVAPKIAPVMSPEHRGAIVSTSNAKGMEGTSLVPTPYTQRRVGAFKVRSDRGYQIMMEVPPVLSEVPEAATDGVLVMEMKATLYRPIG